MEENTRFLRSNTISSSSGLKILRQKSLNEFNHPLKFASGFGDLQLRKENRRASENKIMERIGSASANVLHKICKFCSHLILISIYEQHLNNCPKKSLSQSEAENQNSIEKLEIPQEQEYLERETNIMDNDRNLLQVAIPNQNNFVQDNSRRLFNPFRNLANLFRNSTQDETSQPFLFSPLSFISRVLSGFQNNFHNHENVQNSQPMPSILNEPASNNETQPSGQSHETQNSRNRFPHGALLVRTMQPGPDGSVIVRMRIIPIGGFGGNLEENNGTDESGAASGTTTTDPNEPNLRGGLFGTLLNMFIGLHEPPGENFGDFMNLFLEEKGLEKEQLESLPVVKYSLESFKNVDETSKKCSICLEYFEEEQEVRFLWCIHRFHKNCVDQWLNKHTNCPICKKDYSEALNSPEQMSV